MRVPCREVLNFTPDNLGPPLLVASVLTAAGTFGTDDANVEKPAGGVVELVDRICHPASPACPGVNWLRNMPGRLAGNVPLYQEPKWPSNGRTNAQKVHAEARNRAAEPGIEASSHGARPTAIGDPPETSNLVE